MKYIESPFLDAFSNMALEEYVFEALDRRDEYFMLWQNQNAIVVGRYQNTAAEIDAEFVRDKDIQVVRRLSGGGAMYQDTGNLNFTFVVDQREAKSLDFSVFISPVVRALAGMGVKAEQSSRNDITIEGKKFSGNAQYNRKGRTMHHGTLLFDSDLAVVGKALRPGKAKLESKGVKSVKARVTNIRPYLPGQVMLQQFRQALVREMFSANRLTGYTLSEEDLAAVEVLRREKYATWEWNWGASPAFNLQKQKRYPFGGVELFLQADKGIIKSVEISGDFFGNGEVEELAQKLAGCRLQPGAVVAALQGADVGHYIMGMDAAQLEELVLY